MIRYKLLLFLILLPILTKSKNVRPNYPSSFIDDEEETAPFLDQVAQADTWKTPNRAVSASYTGDPQTGRVDHANLVINVVPRSQNPNSKPVDVDVYASQTLANAKTAEEYVNKALEMKTKYDHTTPSSSFVKYDIYEGEKTKLMPVASTPHSRVTEPMIPLAPIAPKEDLSDMSKSASEYNSFSIEHPQEYVAQTITTTYKHPALSQNSYSSNHKDLDPANSDHYNHHNYNNFMSNVDAVYDPIRHINHDNRHSFDDAMRKLTGYPLSKEEMIKYIERAVKKYLRELESSNKLPLALAGSSSSLGEIKTYYNFPSSTAASPLESSKLYSAGIHSEFFKPSKGINYASPAYSTVKPFSLDTYSPEGVDLTIPSKKRPKPIDLSALDVGQSWQHSTSSHVEPTVTYRKKKKSKHHSSPQAYQDISSLPYIPNRGLAHDEYNAPYSTAQTSFIDHSSGTYFSPSSHKDHSVGASISFGGQALAHSASSPSASSNHHHHKSKHHKHKHHHHHHHDTPLAYHHDSRYHDESKPNFVPSMQVVNGIPITNPYKFNPSTMNMETFNDIFDGGSSSSEKNKFSFTEDFGPSTGAIWNPYNIDLNSLSTRDIGSAASSSSYSFDAYNPKYNNNPEDPMFENYRFGVTDWETDFETPRQRGTTGSDMFGSGSAPRSKKVSQPKRTVTKIIPKPKQRQPKQLPNKEPDRDLVPPPPKKL